ncbi:urease accessory protein UreD [Streptomyces sulfonofaciens]|uniref:Urease accessory protein UreD n=1 Tax=Streptomyces sulfonofaciens TaxID=68272 RepID=A0A919GQQ3_9ACTN|nr:urease accessory protein UreD [Streptomyces sulfonofaciens]GHH89032.1 urease accessory protein UreD [Streptomyces sulfonofaciens]
MSVCGTARVVATDTGLTELHGEGPLALRRTRAAAARDMKVTVVGAMAAPLGGDRLAIDVDVRDGARLIVDSAAATIALPGRTAQPAHYDVRLRVGPDATLWWLPEPVVSADASHLVMHTRVDLAAGARLVLREEQVLGRHGEPPGTLVSRLTVRLAGRPLLDQELAFGPGAPGGWDSAAVLGGHRSVGQLLLVSPRLADHPVDTRVLGETATITPLAGPGALATVLALDALTLRSQLDEVFSTEPCARHLAPAGTRS